MLNIVSVAWFCIVAATPEAVEAVEAGQLDPNTVALGKAAARKVSMGIGCPTLNRWVRKYEPISSLWAPRLPRNQAWLTQVVGGTWDQVQFSRAWSIVPG